MTLGHFHSLQPPTFGTVVTDPAEHPRWKPRWLVSSSHQWWSSWQSITGPLRRTCPCTVQITCTVLRTDVCSVPTSGWAGSRCIPTVLLLLVGGGVNENLPSHPSTTHRLSRLAPAPARMYCTFHFATRTVRAPVSSEGVVSCIRF